MVLLWQHIRSWCLIRFLFLIHFPRIIQSCVSVETNNLSPLDRELKTYVDELVTKDSYKLLPGIDIKKNFNVSNKEEPIKQSCGTSRQMRSLDDYFKERLETYARSHHIAVNVPETARFLVPLDTGKSSFLAGFGMGFLAFALKKLLLPVFVGAQIIKSVLIALFLPSILGNLGKLLGKGLSTFSGASGESEFGHGNKDQIEDFEFKDTSPYNTDGEIQDGTSSASSDTNLSLNMNMASSTDKPDAINRFGYSNNRISYAPYHSDNYYFRKPATKADYKVFHKIPPSSLLLTSYDPFYSPLLSRLDAVFQQLGLAYDKSAQTERCRERLVCMMYANPAKYAPYSNLVSAQLSRELNELRKPSTDNPEILRFFRYMKAAKDGQDGEECLAHGGCPSLTANQASPAMITTFNDINKLVQARKMH